MSNTQKTLWLLALGMLLVAFNMRASVLVLGPLVNQIQQQLLISASAISLLVTLPVICFGVFAFLAPRLAQRFGIEKTLFGCLLIIIVGCLFRGVANYYSLLLGALLLGLSIAFINVLMPGLVKRSFPHRIGLATGAYTVAAGLGATVASGIAVPMTEWFQDWRVPMAFWALPAFIAALCLIPFLRADHKPENSTSDLSGSLWKDSLAWLITIFLAMQSLSYYALAAWLPKILVDHGIEEIAAGNYLAALNGINLCGGLLAPMIAVKVMWQKPLVMSSTLCIIIGNTGLLFFLDHNILLWALLLGVGQGASFGFILTMITIRSRDSQQAAKLSGMAQTGAYLLAAAAPFLFGILKDITHQWTIPLWLLLTCSILQLIIGLSIVVIKRQVGET